MNVFAKMSIYGCYQKATSKVESLQALHFCWTTTTDFGGELSESCPYHQFENPIYPSQTLLCEASEAAAKPTSRVLQTMRFFSKVTILKGDFSFDFPHILCIKCKFSCFNHLKKKSLKKAFLATLLSLSPRIQARLNSNSLNCTSISA